MLWRLLLPDQLFRTHESLYDRLADEYEARAGHRILDATERVERLVPFISSGGTVLDAGCGVGLTLHSLNKVGFLAEGLDASHQMVHYARMRNPSIAIGIGDIRHIRPGKLYDALIADALIHLFPWSLSLGVLNNLRMLVRPGGTVSVSTTLHKFPSEGWRTKDGYASTEVRYRKQWTSDELCSAFEQVGLDILDSYEVRDQEGRIWAVLTGTSRNPGRQT